MSSNVPGPPTLGDYIEKKRIIVCCGAGGVGKTTTSAALALAAARQGRRVLVLTIDPSKRLAETLGVERNRPEPLPLPEERQKEAGIKSPGELSAWMLDPKLVADQVVRRLARTPQEAERLLQNRVYARVTEMIAGMQEYTAMEALHQLTQKDDYDLVVLDTPPSRNALNFLEAPGRLSSFLDGRIFRLFVPKEGGFFRGTTTKLIGMVLSTVFGKEFYEQLTTFFGAFSGIFNVLNGNAKAMRDSLQRPDVAFLMITSPAREAREDAYYFHEKIEELGLPFGGFILNRSQAPHFKKRFPDEDLLGSAPPSQAVSALEKLQTFAEQERRRVDHDRELLRALADRAGSDAIATALPELGEGADDLGNLARLSESLQEADR